jgi:ATP-dependent RNA helicase RhlE
MNFSELGLQKALLTAARDQGYEHATPIQRRAIPEILRGKDILAGAQTGTGKTAAFALPLLQQLSVLHEVSEEEKLLVLVITPTRELAAQEGFKYSGGDSRSPLRSPTTRDD